MERTRTTKIVFPRSNPGLRKPVTAITDRAKRYRANRPEVRPADPKQCAYCGSRKNVGVHHVNGDESVNTRKNLAWACKSCNASIAAIHKANGIGKRTKQYNEGKLPRPAKSLQEYGHLISVMRDGSEKQALRTKAHNRILATPAWMRSAFTAKTWNVRKPDRGRDYDEVPF